MKNSGVQNARKALNYGHSAPLKKYLKISQKKVLTNHMERAIIIELPEKQKQKKRRQEPC